MHQNIYISINEPQVNLLSFLAYKISMIIKHIIFPFLVLMVLSCDTNNHIRIYNLPKPKANNFPSTHLKKDTGPSELIWEKPDSWMPSDGSAMRLASFAVPYSGGSGDLSVIKLSGNGGGIESNVNRWRRQLNLDSQALVEMEKNILIREGKLGTISILKIMNQKMDSAFLCAIIPMENHTIFVKLSLRPVGILEVEDDFIAFCSSLNFPK